MLLGRINYRQEVLHGFRVLLATELWIGCMMVWMLQFWELLQELRERGPGFHKIRQSTNEMWTSLTWFAAEKWPAFLAAFFSRACPTHISNIYAHMQWHKQNTYTRCEMCVCRTVIPTNKLDISNLTSRQFEWIMKQFTIFTKVTKSGTFQATGDNQRFSTR